MLNFPIPPADEAEIIRVSGLGKPNDEELDCLRKRLEEIEPLLAYTITERVLPKESLKSLGISDRLGTVDAILSFTAGLGPAAARLAEETDPEEEILFIVTRGILEERVNALIEAYCDYKAEQFSRGDAFLTPHIPDPQKPDRPSEHSRLCGISQDHSSHTPERCRSCFVTSCPSRRN